MTKNDVLAILEKYKLHMPPTVYYELQANIVNFEEPTPKNDLGVDCISRADAIKGLGEQPYVWTDSDFEIQQLEDWKAHKEMLENLPSVTPQEPKKGHWVHGEYCSECGCDVPAYIIDWKWQKDMNAKYCPNCGCRMVEPQKSEDKK